MAKFIIAKTVFSACLVGLQAGCASFNWQNNFSTAPCTQRTEDTRTVKNADKRQAIINWFFSTYHHKKKVRSLCGTSTKFITNINPASPPKLIRRKFQFLCLLTIFNSWCLLVLMCTSGSELKYYRMLL